MRLSETALLDMLARNVGLSESLAFNCYKDEDSNSRFVSAASCEVHFQQQKRISKAAPDAKTSGQPGFGRTHFTEPWCPLKTPRQAAREVSHTASV